MSAFISLSQSCDGAREFNGTTVRGGNAIGVVLAIAIDIGSNGIAGADRNN